MALRLFCLAIFTNELLVVAAEEVVIEEVVTLDETARGKSTRRSPAIVECQEDTPKCAMSKPLRCSDDSEPLKAGCCKYVCPPGTMECFTWAMPPQESPCNNDEDPVRTGCEEFSCPNGEKDNAIMQPGPVVAAGRVYVPLPNTALTSAVNDAGALGKATLQQQTANSGTPMRFRERLLRAALSELGLAAEPFTQSGTRAVLGAANQLHDEATRAQAGQVDVGKWLAQARDEHASVAAFAMLQLELLAHGAPLDLVGRVLTASQEELDHASACMALAGSQARLVLPAHDVRARMQQDWPRLLHRSVHEGAVPEGNAALRLWREAHDEHRAERPARAQVLWAMGHEEASHAELAHDIALWAAAASGVEVPAVHIEAGGVFTKAETQAV